MARTVTRPKSDRKFVEEVDRNINRSTATNLDRLWIEIKAAWDTITPEIDLAEKV